MRKDQQDRVDNLAERLADVFMTEADPDNWTGADQPAAKMTPEIRGARNWDVKNANQVGALLMRTIELRDRISGGSANPYQGGEDDRAESNIAKYEKEAKRLLESVGARRGGSAP